MKITNTAAIMPIKLNNERLPGKNIMLLGGRPLLQHELIHLQETGLVDSISVFCSSETVNAYLPEGTVFVRRPEYLDLPSSNFTQIFEEFISVRDAEIYIYAHATAPFVTVETMRACIEAVTSGKFDSAFCAVRIQDYLWLDGKPMNFDAANLPRSQDLKPVYRETSGVYVFRKDVFSQYRRRIGKHPYIREVGYKEAVDINTPEDFRLAEALINVDL